MSNYPKSVIRLFHAYTTFFLLSFLPIFSYNGTPLRPTKNLIKNKAIII